MTARTRHDVALPGVSFWLAVALIVQVLLVRAAFERVDQFRDLWYCHAFAGYSHPDLLDACLANAREARGE